MKSLKKTLPKLILASLLTFGIYMAYYVTIGVPKTEARNFYNEGIKAQGLGNTELAKKDFQKALTFWHEQYIQDELDKLN